MLIKQLLAEARPMEYIPSNMISKVRKLVDQHEGWEIEEIGKGDMNGDNTATSFHFDLCKEVEGEKPYCIKGEYLNTNKQRTLLLKQGTELIAKKPFKDNDVDTFLTALTYLLKK